MNRAIAMVVAGLGLAANASAAHALQESVVAVRLNPGETAEVTALGLPAASGWSSVDTLVAVVADGRVIRAREWGRTRVLLHTATGETRTIQVHVAPTGVYAFSGVLGSSARGSLNRITRPVTGSLTFTPVEGGTMIESDCGNSAVMLDREGQFFLECGNVGFEFHYPWRGDPWPGPDGPHNPCIGPRGPPDGTAAGAQARP